MQPLGPIYQHTPLLSDGSTFRIVSIYPGTEDDDIKCGFLEVLVSAKPKYSALSYAWGDPAIVTRVWNHGRIIGVTQNLQQALKRLRDPIRVRTFWIHALCIDQQNDSEKATQIPLMRRIYQQAYVVSIHLGKEQIESEEIPSILARIEKAYFKSDAGKPASSRHDNLAFDRHLLGMAEYSKVGLPDYTSDKWRVVRKLLMRPWFSQVWVIQEAALCNSVEVICGTWVWTGLPLLTP
jgi:hypothetical protein